MSSQKQIDANRRNAQSSPGPRSLAGKARSRLNAVRDGLTGQITTLSEKDRPVFEQLKTEILADFNPKTAIERRLANAIAWDTWRLDHLRAIEMNVYALGIEEELADEVNSENEENAEDAAETATAENAPFELDEFDTALSDARTFRAEAKRFELMSLYEQRMNRNMHRNLATLRDLQAERKRNYEADMKDEVIIARFNEINGIEIHASKMPSKNGFVFSDDEIAIATVRQRYVETARFRMDDLHPNLLYGNTLVGNPDSFLTDLKESKANSAKFPPKIHGISPESIALRRQSHPEEFGLLKR